MRVLVTGGAGFIGSHLVDRLINDGHEVVVLDNLSFGKKEWVNKKARLVLGDIRDPTTVATALQGCEAVFHLAALTDARSSDDDAIYQVNYLGSENVFNLAAAKKCKIIFTSSAAVYGEAFPCREAAECAPMNQYGKSKLKAEALLQRLDSDAFVARLFNCYGPRAKSVVNKFCDMIPNYKDIIIFGSGLQTRDFVHVNDVVNALVLGMKNSGVYNVGTGVETSVLHLVDTIHYITRAKPDTKFTAPVPGDIRRSRAETEKIKAIGWETRISLEDGLRTLLDETGWKPLQI